MKRFIKKRLHRFLPAGLRTSIKRRFAAKFAEPVGTQFLVEEGATALKCKIDNIWSFLAPLVCKPDLMNITSTPEGRSEIYGILEAAKKGGVLFDIGAHSGLISAVFCAVNQRNKVFSFEPSPVLAERLAAVHHLNQFEDRMRIEQIGIGERSETIELLLDPAGGFVQPKHFEHTMWAAPESVQVRLETMADAAGRLDSVPDFIKIDIESYEFEAIKGSIEFLARHKPAIFLELHLNYLEQRGLPAKAVTDILGQCGYRFYTSTGASLTPGEVYDSPLPIVHIIAR